jgi:hypothetical protein
MMNLAKLLGLRRRGTPDACVNIGGLRLKAIVHTGTATFYKIGDFTELARVDVIIVHRLLKNSVKLQEYILLTEAAFQEISIPSQVEAQQLEETYPTIGTLRTYLYPIHSPIFYAFDLLIIRIPGFKHLFDSVIRIGTSEI